MYKFTKKYLFWGKLRINGKNKQQKVVCYHKSGGHKKLYRFIDLFHYIWNIYGIVYSIFYNNINKFSLHFIIYLNGFFTYNICIQKIKIGDIIFSSNFSFFINYNGFTFFLKNIPTGLFISNLELLPYKKSQYIRSPGTYARIIALNINKKICLIRLKSYYIIKSFNNCICIFGKICSLNKSLKWKKASYYIYNGWRPIVRGVAMNPIDHPHGGGQGKTSGGRPSCTPWAFYTKGYKTRQINKRRNYVSTKILKKYGSF